MPFSVGGYQFQRGPLRDIVYDEAVLEFVRLCKAGCGPSITPVELERSSTTFEESFANDLKPLRRKPSSDIYDVPTAHDNLLEPHKTRVVVVGDRAEIYFIYRIVADGSFGRNDKTLRLKCFRLLWSPVGASVSSDPDSQT